MKVESDPRKCGIVPSPRKTVPWRVGEPWPKPPKRPATGGTP